MPNVWLDRTGDKPLVLRQSINTSTESLTNAGAPICLSSATLTGAQSTIFTSMLFLLSLVGNLYCSFQCFHAGLLRKSEGVWPNVFLNARENDSGFSKRAS